MRVILRWRPGFQRVQRLKLAEQACWRRANEAETRGSFALWVAVEELLQAELLGEVTR